MKITLSMPKCVSIKVGGKVFSMFTTNNFLKFAGLYLGGPFAFLAPTFLQSFWMDNVHISSYGSTIVFPSNTKC